MVKILQGDCREVLKTLPDASVNCCVTSPPYWGLRDYGCDGQLGLEPTPETYVANLVAVFREVHRVMRDDGTLWLNLGDSYAGSGKGQTANGCADPKQPKLNGMKLPVYRPCNPKSSTLRGGKNNQLSSLRSYENGFTELSKKNLIGIPWRVAFALQADGWYLRQDIIWNKPNPMPESVTDRCTKAHEYIFLLTKSARYYYDAEAIKEETVTNDDVLRDRETTKLNNVPGRKRMEGLVSNNYEMRNKRSVWTVCTHPYKDSHFATFPPALITPCILAGCPKHGTVLDPFGGSGTVGEVSETAGRNSILIELNPAYVTMANRRTAQQGLFTKGEV
jgi:DNA modification methylase